jgi:hypothetical protein
MRVRLFVFAGEKIPAGDEKMDLLVMGMLFH